MMKIEILKKSLFEANDHAADENREWFEQQGVLCVNIMGGAGCGKTTLLEHVIPMLMPRLSIAVLEGDLATTRDAERIAALHVPVVQLLTEGGCHLTATLVQKAIETLAFPPDLLLIENVGNPVCPVNFNLGEHLRVAVLSVAEGDDKPAKYPYLFKTADAVVIAKTDLLAATNFDVNRACDAIRALGAGKTIIPASMRDTLGTRKLADWLRARHRTLLAGWAGSSGGTRAGAAVSHRC